MTEHSFVCRLDVAPVFSLTQVEAVLEKLFIFSNPLQGQRVPFGKDGPHFGKQGPFLY